MEDFHNTALPHYRMNIDENGVVDDDNTQAPIDRAQAEQAPEQAPEKILGKFESQSALENAYKELEKRLSNNDNTETDETITEGSGAKEEEVKLPSDEGQETDTENVDDTETVDESDSPDLDEVDDTPLTVKENVDEAFLALSQAGEMTEEVQAEFDKVGISKELVEQFSDLVKFKSDALFEKQVAIVGTKEQYIGMLDWAKDNLSDTEISMFDKVIDGGSHDEISIAITNLNDKMKGSSRKSRLIKADNTSPGRSTYADAEDYYKDQHDERYKTDTKYRGAVDAKLARSKFNKKQ